MNDDARTAKWFCQKCGAEAGTITVEPDGAIERRSFTGTLDYRLGEEAAERLRVAILLADMATILAIDYELASFWCPECQKVYCGQCWHHWAVMADDFPGFTDSIRGRCPEGHERKLED